jgi:hypothetical protein
VALLFQTGYLTIVRMESGFDGTSYRLRPPNHEVRTALNRTLLQGYTGLMSQSRPMQTQLYEAVTRGDTEGMRQSIFRLFAAIPYRNLDAGDLPDYEGYYASVLYAFFASLGVTIIPEDISNHGQVDMTVRTEGQVYVLELKVVAGASVEGNPALAQIIARDYAAKYRGQAGLTVHEIGAIFSRQTRNLIAWDVGTGISVSSF